jgi:hypothetical protein
MKTKLGSLLLLAMLGRPGLIAVAQWPSPPGTFTGSMITPRFAHTATLVNNGKVLIAGDRASAQNSMIPPVKTFTRTGDMTTQRARF